jgi:hypothetical protein
MNQPLMKLDPYMYALMRSHFAWCDQQLKTLFPGVKFGTANDSHAAEPNPAGGNQ